jgi:hypothetical protein
MGSNPAVFWMDVSDASSYYRFNENGNKGSQTGHTKKIFKTNTFVEHFCQFLISLNFFKLFTSQALVT